MRDLTPLLAPRSVAVIGASGNLESLAGRPVRNLLASQADIAIYPVNPRREEIGGLRCYPDVWSVPQAPDVALILTPAAAVPSAVKDAAQRGTRAAIVVTSGFAEIGDAGVEAQRRLAEIARAGDMILVGPNTLGVNDYRRGLPLSFAWYGRRPTSSAGSVVVVTQSGSGMTSLCDRLLDLDLPLGHGVATGNEADLTITDLLEHFAELDEVRVVASVFEQIRDGPRFLAACRRLRQRGKTLVVLKQGRTASGNAAARSHTGSLAGSYAVVRALLAQNGVLEVDDLDDIGPTVEAALPGRCPRGRRFAVATSSGAAAVISADRADELGLELPEFSADAQVRLREYLPSFSSGVVHNPIDTTAQAMNGRSGLPAIVSIALAEEHIDAVIAGVPSGAGEMGLELADSIIQIVAAAEKPVLFFILSGEESTAQRRRLRAGGVPVFHSPGAAVQALERLTHLGAPEQPPAAGAVGAVTIDGEDPGTVSRAASSEFETLAWLRDHGIPTVEQALAHTAEEAIAAARRLGLPVAVKLSSPDVTHKTEVGGVALDLRDLDAVGAAFETVTSAARRANPAARIEGVTVAPMVSSTVELIVGVNRDPTFGLILALGLGGIWTEILQDVALRGLPLAQAGVADMVDELSGSGLLRGARGLEPVDQGALDRLVVSVAELAARCGPRLRAIDLNPVAVTDRGLPVVLDGAIYLDPEQRPAGGG